ncbi:maleylpyruvate isomerase family mycothiol-dependent enzyme [Humibacillus xanthopallidus]|uniref:maleylpyruvate isomerase family mycothiol-dependent enzyme n=1 Tax=Humibacillus xanthopallidus TaxID=412689 RepID=UPI00384DAFA2
MPSGPSDLAAPPFLDHLASESARFRAVLAEAPSVLRVPTCPDWDADDLLWHLAEVQWFWGEIAAARLTTQAEVDELDGRRVERPVDRAGLLEHFDRSSSTLQMALASLDPATELWMWADEHTAGYIARRQAHEALIHRLDAELTVGDRTPLDCRLAADGIDEALRIMRGYEPEPGLTHETVSPSVTIVTVDAMHAWTVTPVRVTGSHEGRELDLRRFLVADGPDDRSTAEICGSAADLDCWLWNRPTDAEVVRDGDAGALAAVDAVLTDSID